LLALLLKLATAAGAELQLAAAANACDVLQTLSKDLLKGCMLLLLTRHTSGSRDRAALRYLDV
jgi:hypothetical protein